MPIEENKDFPEILKKKANDLNLTQITFLEKEIVTVLRSFLKKIFLLAFSIFIIFILCSWRSALFRSLFLRLKEGEIDKKVIKLLEKKGF